MDLGRTLSNNNPHLSKRTLRARPLTVTTIVEILIPTQVTVAVGAEEMTELADMEGCIMTDQTTKSIGPDYNKLLNQ